MKAHLNEFTREYWRGEDRKTAADYVTKQLPASSSSFIYSGRIGGVATEDQAALRKLEAEIKEEVFTK